MDSVPAPAPGPIPVDPLPAPPLVLQYDTGRPRRRPIEMALFLPATVAGAVAAFLPFTWNVSPFEVVLHTDDAFGDALSKVELLLILLAWSFLVPTAMLALRLRTLLVGPLSSPERNVAYVVAGLSSAAVVTCVVIMLTEASRLNEYVITATGAAFVAAGAAMFLKVARNGGGDAAAAVALLAAYVANSAIALVGFHDAPELGWYVTLCAAGAALAEVITLAATSRKRV